MLELEHRAMTWSSNQLSVPHGILVAAAVLLCCVAPTLAQGSGSNVTLSSKCLEDVSAQIKATPDILTNTSLFSEQVFKCIVYNGGIIRPIRILVPLETQRVAWLLQGAFKAKTGYDVVFEYQDVEKIGETILDPTTGRQQYDGWVSDPRWIVDLSQQGFLQPLDQYIADDTKFINWTDVNRFFRLASSVYNNSVVGIPITGRIAQMYYREDVFEKADLPYPKTWQDLIAVMKAINGTDMNGDGVGDWAVCWQIQGACIEREWLVSSILASFTQTQGTSSGWLFDLDTMSPFVESVAFSKTLELLEEFLLYTYPTTLCEDVITPFQQGKCAMAGQSDSLFKAIQLPSPLFNNTISPFKSKIGYAPVPGSSQILNHKSGVLEDCTPSTCPYANYELSANKTRILVNRASFTGYASISGYVNANSPPAYSRAAYMFFAVVSSNDISMQLVLAPNSVNQSSPFSAFRNSQLSTRDSDLLKWTVFGYSAPDVKRFLNNLNDTLSNANDALDIRINGGGDFKAALKQAGAMLVLGVNTSAIQDRTIRTFRQVMAQHNPETFANGYYQALNNPKRFVYPSPPLPPPTIATPPSSSSNSFNAPLVLGLVLGIGVPVLLAAVLIGLWFHKAGLALFGIHHAPGVGPQTTLVVTDIENSTMLWETLEQETMNQALDMHHKLVRSLLTKRNHLGYESATEGDSFIMSFHTPMTALIFAQALQNGLLNVEWSPQLLESQYARPLWAQAVVPSLVAIHTSDQQHSPTESPKAGFLAGLLQNPMRRVSTPLDNLVTNPSADSQSISFWRVGQAPREAATAQGDGSTSMTADAISFLRSQWHECSAPPNKQANANVHLVFRGLRVRIGLHSGVYQDEDVKLNKTTGRWQYSGRPLSMAKAVGDCGHGGMVLLSHECFEQMPIHTLPDFGQVVHMGDVTLNKDRDLPPTSLYQIVSGAMKPRLSFLEPKLRSVRQLQVGALEAPIGQCSIAFTNLVGVSTLLAWDREKAEKAIQLYHLHAVTLLTGVERFEPGVTPEGARSGYVVELAGSLCLAAFHSSLSAVQWGLHLVQALLSADWDPELLQHELCEEILLRTGATDEMARRRSQLFSNTLVLFRGPRIKIGIDTGPLHAALNPTTGRMAYRGRVMNRASRIADKAHSGQVWCSAAAWMPCDTNGMESVEALELGMFQLKGVSGEVKLMQCNMAPTYRRASQHTLPASCDSPMAAPSPREPSASTSSPARLAQPSYTMPAQVGRLAPVPVSRSGSAPMWPTYDLALDEEEQQAPTSADVEIDNDGDARTDKRGTFAF